MKQKKLKKKTRMTAQSLIKAKNEMLVPNTAVKDRPEPGSERPFQK